MPVIFKITKKMAVLGRTTDPILELFARVVSSSVPKAAEGEATSATRVGEARLRDKLLARYLYRTIELLTKERGGASNVELPSENLELDPPAYILLAHYIDYLNGLLLEESVGGAKATEKSEIDNAYVLVRELLIRLVSIALSNNMDVYHDGDALIKALQDFCSALFEGKILISSLKLRGEKVGNFLQRFSTGHGRWIREIKKMVRAIQDIHANKTAISEVLNKLRLCESKIKMQLAAFLRAPVATDGFSPNWIQTTWSRVEAHCVAEDQKLLKASGQMVASDVAVQEQLASGEVLDGGRLERVIDSDKKISNPEIRSKLMKLNEMRVEFDRLFEIMSHVDLLISYTGWVPILLGIINFSKLSHLLQNFAKRYMEAMSLGEDPTLQDILKSRYGVELVTYQATDGELLGAVLMTSSQAVLELDSLALKHRISTFIGAAATSIVRLQTGLPQQYQFVNQGKIEELQRGLGGRALLGASRETAASSIRFRDQEKQNKALVQENERLQEQLSIMGRVAGHEEPTHILHQLLMQQAEPAEYVFDLLLQRGASLTIFCVERGLYQGYTALHLAAATNKLASCRWIAKHLKDINVPDSHGETALDKASMRHHLSIVNFLLAQRGTSARVDNCTKELHRLIGAEEVTEQDASVTQDLVERLNDLVSCGADVNAVNVNLTAWKDNRVLHTLVMKGNKKLIRWAMEQGADPTLTKLSASRSPETPFEYLMRASRHREAIKAFLGEEFPGRFFEEEMVETPDVKEAHPRSGGAEDSGDRATRGEEPDSSLQEVLLVVNQMADHEQLTHFLHNLLKQEAEPAECVLDLMLQRGINLMAPCVDQGIYQGYTALHLAAATNKLATCKWIAKHLKDINVLDSHGETALDKASMRQHLSIVKFLVARKGTSAEVDDCTQKLHGLIDQEVTEEEVSATEELMKRLNGLVSRGADVNGVNVHPSHLLAWRENRPLHTLLAKGNKKLIRWVMEQGADPTLTKLSESRPPETPYEYLMRTSRHKEALKAFLGEEFPGRFFEQEVDQIPAAVDAHSRTSSDGAAGDGATGGQTIGSDKDAEDRATGGEEIGSDKDAGDRATGGEEPDSPATPKRKKSLRKKAAKAAAGLFRPKSQKGKGKGSSEVTESSATKDNPEGRDSPTGGACT